MFEKKLNDIMEACGYREYSNHLYSRKEPLMIMFLKLIDGFAYSPIIYPTALFTYFGLAWGLSFFLSPQWADLYFHTSLALLFIFSLPHLCSSATSLYHDKKIKRKMLAYFSKDENLKELHQTLSLRYSSNKLHKDFEKIVEARIKKKHSFDYYSLLMNLMDEVDTPDVQNMNAFVNAQNHEKATKMALEEEKNLNDKNEIERQLESITALTSSTNLAQPTQKHNYEAYL